jgi:hypothetical protein
MQDDRARDVTHSQRPASGTESQAALADQDITSMTRRYRRAPRDSAARAARVEIVGCFRCDALGECLANRF